MYDCFTHIQRGQRHKWAGTGLCLAAQTGGVRHVHCRAAAWGPADRHRTSSGMKDKRRKAGRRRQTGSNIIQPGGTGLEPNITASVLNNIMARAPSRGRTHPDFTTQATHPAWLHD
jgi:hypothetical protein